MDNSSWTIKQSIQLIIDDKKDSLWRRVMLRILFIKAVLLSSQKSWLSKQIMMLKIMLYRYVSSSRMSKNVDILGAFGCQWTGKSSLGE